MLAHYRESAQFCIAAQRNARWEFYLAAPRVEDVRFGVRDKAGEYDKRASSTHR